MSGYTYNPTTKVLTFNCNNEEMSLNKYVGLFCENNNVEFTVLAAGLAKKFGINRMIEQIVAYDVTPYVTENLSGNTEELANLVDVICLVVKEEILLSEASVPLCGVLSEDVARDLKKRLKEIMKARKERSNG